MKTRASFLAILVVCAFASAAHAKLVACIGDSITYGSGISDPATNGYPAQLQRILRQYDPAWQVTNYGVSGATLLRRGDKPYIREVAYTSALAAKPDIVVIKLGTNDSKPQNWQYKADFVTDYSNMIDAFRALPSKPVVWICKPVPAFAVNFSIRPEVIRDEILPLIEQISREKNAPMIDLYTALADHGNLFPDSIHPNAEGAGLIAQTVAPFLLGVRYLPDYNRDGVMNLRDFAVMAQSWLQADPNLDIAPPPSGDGVIGYQDLAGLGTYWMSYPGLVAHWKLDETDGNMASDSAGKFSGTVYGSAQWRPGDGIVRGALELDGVDDYIGTDPVLNPADGPFTLFVWVKGGGPGQAILSQSGGTGQPDVWLGVNAAGALVTNLSDVSRLSAPLVSQAVITDGSWHLIRFVWDGSQRCLYVDGVQAAADTRKLAVLRAASGGFNIGAGKDLQAGSFWSGLLDDIRLYNRAVKP